MPDGKFLHVDDVLAIEDPSDSAQFPIAAPVTAQGPKSLWRSWTEATKPSPEPGSCRAAASSTSSLQDQLVLVGAVARVEGTSLNQLIIESLAAEIERVPPR
jgi:hypothetical protein